MVDWFHLRPEYRRVLEALLREHLSGVEVWAYGSRVNGRGHDGSDFALVLRGPGLTEIPSDQLADFREAVRESIIPFFVEARDWASLPESIHWEIKRDYVALMAEERGAVNGWRDMPFAEAVLVNPTVRLERGREYPFVNMAAIDPGSRCVQETEQRKYTGGGSRFQDGDTLMARITPCLENGKIARYCKSRPSEAAHGSTEFIVIRGRPELTDTDFAYYLTKWDKVRNYAISQMTGTSGRQRVSIESLHHLTVSIPPLPEQRGIAHILGALDDKIERNQRMNDTLEEMVRAIFKDWFIDFGPVRAKIESRESRLPKDIANLFPDRMVETEVGEFPIEWKHGTLDERLESVTSGQRPRGGAIASGIPSVGAENVIGLGKYDFSREKYIPHAFFGKLKDRGCDVRNGDVLLYKDGAHIGRITYFDCGFPHAKCAVNEHVLILRMTNSIEQRYLYLWLDQEFMTREIVSLNSNSAQPGISQSGVRTLSFLYPGSRIVEKFDDLVGDMFDKILANSKESLQLSALREALLPRLMSGELRMSDADFDGERSNAH